jgi:unsaturated rhamnogalacturonyl hydrolase
VRTATGLLILLCLPLAATAQTLPDKSDIVASMRLVNDYWIGENPDPGDNQWARAAYFAGNMAMYATWPDDDYRDYALLWAQNHSWSLNGGTGTTNADNQCAGQTYVALYNIDPVPSRIADITTCISNMVGSSQVSNWSWIDAIYMSMPVFSGLGVIHNDTNYFDKMYDLYDDNKSRRGLYDSGAGLWYRDQGYKPPATTPNGQPIFWSRGNGWVFAAHAKVLEALPVSDPHRAEYLATFQAMAAALKDVQRTDGFWNVSLADPLDHPGPETSGTAFFTYGMAWGINNGYLDGPTYLPVVTKAWNGLNQTAVHPDGFIGYVQGPASDPSEGQPVTYNTTTDYAVGLFLMAGSEVYELAGGDPAPAPHEVADNMAYGNVIAWSGQETGNEATHAVDDHLWTRWSSQGYPQWIELDLGSAQAIGTTEVAPYLGRAYQFTIETKVNSGDPYTLVVDRTSNTTGGNAIVDVFPAVTARYVRLTVTGASGYTGDWASILELKLYSNTSTGVLEAPPALSMKLEQNVPNPFNPTTTIGFSLAEALPARLIVYDVAGRRVKTLVDETTTAGPHRVTWDGTDDAGRRVASGVYFYRLTAGASTETKKMMLLK